MTAELVARSYVDGDWADIKQGVVGVFDPADLDNQIGAAWTAGPDTALRAVDAAQRALPGWAAQSVVDRAAALHDFVDLLERETDEMASLITHENGKLLAEARTEVASTIADARYQLTTALTMPPDLPAPSTRSADVRTQVYRQPLGTVLAITPWNFPLSTICRKLIPAAMLGNTVIVKPSELTPLTAHHCFELIDRAGLPPGVAQLVLGEGPSVGQLLADAHQVAGITFTGSTQVGRQLARQAARRSVRLQLEMGGKNALVVLADADVDAAADAAAAGGFSCAGQWCVGTSRVIADESVYDAMVERIAARASRLTVGPGWDPGSQMGPVISAAQQNRVARYIQDARDSRATLIAGGTSHDTVDGLRGHYVDPTVFAEVSPEAPLARDEVFGPVVSILRATGAEDALRLVNDSPYGLSASVYTGDRDVGRRFVADVHAGLCHVNLPTFYREGHLPLGGWADSGYGTPECGDFALEAFTRVKAAYVG